MQKIALHMRVLVTLLSAVCTQLSTPCQAAPPGQGAASAQTDVSAKRAAQNIHLLRQAAEQGDAEAQFYLGVTYATGEGVRQDAAEAVRWYRKAAEQGNAKAQFNLGVSYTQGQGVRQNHSIAKEWFGKACDNGLQAGCDQYRLLNERGVR